MKQKKFFFFEKKFKMADSKKLSFSTSSKAEQIPPKFHGFNFYYNDGLQPKIMAGIINEHECIF